LCVISTLSRLSALVQSIDEVLLQFALTFSEHRAMGVVFCVLLLPSELVGLGIGALVHLSRLKKARIVEAAHIF